MNAAHLFNASVMTPGTVVVKLFPSMGTRFRAMILPMGSVTYAKHVCRGTSKVVDIDVFTSIMQRTGSYAGTPANLSI